MGLFSSFNRDLVQHHLDSNLLEYISEMSTINQVTKEYPPTFLSVGDADPFYSQNISFYKKLKSKDVPVDKLFYDGLINLTARSICFNCVGYFESGANA